VLEITIHYRDIGSGCRIIPSRQAEASPRGQRAECARVGSSARSATPRPLFRREIIIDKNYFVRVALKTVPAPRAADYVAAFVEVGTTIANSKGNCVSS